MKQMEIVKSDVGMSWEMVKIPEVLFFMEGPGVRNTQFTTQGVKLLNVGNINDGLLDLDATTKFISEKEAYGKYKHFLVEDGDLLIASSGIVVDNFHNKITWAKAEDLPLCMNTSTIRFKTLDSNILDIRFFSYFIKTKLFTDQLRKLITGSAQLNFGPSHLKQISLPLPPLPIQKRIAEILDAADALKRKDQELLKKYDELAQAIFIDMFGDPVKNEKGWETKKFQELGTLDRGVSKHRPRNAPELLGGKYPLIQTGDVANSGGIITKYRSTYSEIGLKQSKMWSKGTLCITIAANIAKTGILDFDACFPDSIVGFKPNDKVSNSVFVQFWIGFLQKILEDNAPESAQKNINLEILRGLDVICPPVELQNKFEKIIEQLNLVKSSNSNFVADNLFQTLIQKAFKGELVAE